MRRRSRVRRVGKWVGAAACLLVVGAWLLSGWYTVTNSPSRSPMKYMFMIDGGNLSVWWQKPSEAFYFVDVERHVQRRHSDEPFVALKWPAFGQFTLNPGVTVVYATVPLWLLFVLAALPTAFLWLRDRRPAPGHCATCGYDLTGNVSGRCPECGEQV